ncbi:MAG: glyoxylase-like metal-dependent hydrolase (beta-lactamase superfamily II) [Paracoccaceae bacterium]|jgi:glyoxylase-like metal-dependent hydrolase (beta-lactamase superfamily II)
MSAAKLRVRPAAWYRFDIGDFEATVVSDGTLELGDATQLFPNAPKDEVRRLFAAEFLQCDPMVLAENALVLNTGAHLVLFDTGMGTSSLFGPHSGRLLGNMAAAGIDPRDIDTVILTHAHADHTWGLLDDAGQPTFPNASICLSRADFDFWTDEAKLSDPAARPDVVRGSIRCLTGCRDQLRFVVDGEVIVPGITAIATPGHTIGHMSQMIESAGVKMLNLGDVCHQYALVCPNPDWQFHVDYDPVLGVKSRRRMLELAAREQLFVLGYHLPFPGLGHMVHDGDGYRYIPAHMQFG